MKICKGCGTGKDITDFYETSYVRKDGTRARAARCKDCQPRSKPVGQQREAVLRYQRRYYRTHGKTAARELRRERLGLADAIKTANPCSDCGHAFPPECMDFDHVDPSRKLFNISTAVAGTVPWRRVLAEIEKCRIICSNCHRIRTARQQRRGG